jgi:hypothetical protein
MRGQIPGIGAEQCGEIAAGRIPRYDDALGMPTVPGDVSLDPRERRREVLDVRRMAHAG